jgi:ATP-dependent DNA helicase PIF1
MILNKKQQEAYNYISNGENIFITGGGGVGKSALIKYIYQHFRDHKKIACTSTTGTSAILIGGMTLHSYLGIGLGTAKVESLVKKIRSRPVIRQRWQELDMLIIDEISMLSPELFEKLDKIACRLRRKSLLKGKYEPFGGIQMILSGDFCQLRCVNSDTFCFESEVWKKCITRTVHLTEIIRQDDKTFQKCLNEIRLGKVSPETQNVIESRVKASIKNDLGIKPTRLYSMNYQVDQVNSKKIKQLIEKNGEVYEYPIEYTLKNKKMKLDRLKRHNSAVEYLELTTNCQVMLICNLDLEAGLANGSRGVVTGFEGNFPIVKFMDGSSHLINYYTWEIEENDQKIGEICQLPLKLAYAFSIHKSQGATLDCVKIDLSNIFDFGMGYVALSRVRNLSGLSIVSNFSWGNINTHPTALEFYREIDCKSVDKILKYIIYTDGSCLRNPGSGGYAGVILDSDNNKISQVFGSDHKTTNNRMELQAVIKVLIQLKEIDPKPGSVEVFTDSKYVQQGISEWILKWKQNGWKRGSKDILNIDLWKELDELNSPVIEWKWVKAHNGNQWNEYVDNLARKCAETV